MPPLFDPQMECALLPQMVSLTLARLEDQFGRDLSRPRYAAYLLTLAHCCMQRADSLCPGVSSLPSHEVHALLAGTTPAPPS